MDETLMKVRILARAEMTMARIHGQQMANRVKLYSIALGLLLLTVVMAISLVRLSEAFISPELNFVITRPNSSPFKC